MDSSSVSSEYSYEDYDGGDDEKLEPAVAVVDDESASDSTSDSDSAVSDDESNDELAPVAIEPEISKYIKEVIVVRPENMRTSNIMSKFEMTEHISIRAEEISKYNNCMVSIEGLSDPVMMAKRELMLRKSPLTLRRHVGDVFDPVSKKIETYYEYLSPNELMFAVEYNDVM